jgi:hypothetical protein
MPGIDDSDLDDEDEFGGPNYTRHLDDLEAHELDILRRIKSPQDIQSCQVMNDWVDDHEVCIGVILNGVEFGAWWCGWETGAAFLYWEHPKAKEKIAEYVNQSVTQAIEDEREDEADNQREEEAQDLDDEITSEYLPQRPQ